jgi:c-di-AMP phosphodiesterase-like protein
MVSAINAMIEGVHKVIILGLRKGDIEVIGDKALRA